MNGGSPAAMDSVFGFVGDGFALIAADTSAVQSIIVHKSNEDKIMVLDSHKLLGASGEAGDRAQFTEYIQKNVHLSQIRNGVALSTAAAANFIRSELTTALRKCVLCCLWLPRRNWYQKLKEFFVFSA